MGEKLEMHSQKFNYVYKRNHTKNLVMMLEDKHYFKFESVITYRNISYYDLLGKIMKYYSIRIKENKGKSKQFD